MVGKLPALLSAVVGDACAALGAPGGASIGVIAGYALDGLLRRRQEHGREILVDELKSGEKQLVDVAELEEAVAILYRYFRAAQEGSARLNLRLMAQVIAGQTHMGNLVADEFLYYADILASLRREEILLIATLYKHRNVEGKISPQKVAMNELIPVVFSNEDEFRATAGPASRTGLIIGASGFGTIVYDSSPLMARLARLVSFEDVLRRET